MNKLVFVAALLLSSVNVFAATPVCHSSHNGYCQYNGKVRSIYINASGVILLYFDSNMDVSEGVIAGMSLTHGNAAAVLLSENIEFAKLFYATALSAQASQRPVTLQMRGTISGYMKADRIWLSE